MSDTKIIIIVLFQRKKKDDDESFFIEELGIKRIIIILHNLVIYRNIWIGIHH